MPRYFLKLAYNGTKFHGWQKQKGGIRTVQEEIERALNKILNQNTEITGCGRTDTGVHAFKFYAHIDIIEPPKNLLYSVNGILPKDLVIDSIFEVKPDAHCRFDATSRTYKYFVHQQKDPFSNGMSYFVPKKLDIDIMNKGAKILLNTEDFTSFSKLHSNTFTNVCDVTFAKWSYLSNNKLQFEITANRFLRNMVRAIVGTLIQLGQHKISIEDFEQIISTKNRNNAGKSVFGGALFLTEITYPYSLEGKII